MEEIKKELLELGFSANSKGILYWIDLIELGKNKTGTGIVELYKEIAKTNDTSYTNVERCLRVALEPAKENIKKKYKYNNKISNLTFLNLKRYELI